MVQRVLDAYNARDPEALEALYAPNAITRRPGWPAPGGVEEIVASAEMDTAAFPDLRIEPLSSASEGATIFTEVRITGTNTGEIVLGDFGRGATETTTDTYGATGRAIDVVGVLVHEFDGEGSIVAERQYWGMLEMRRPVLSCSCRFHPA
jgi:hypothetical protein